MKYILSITILIILTGCAGNSPEIYQSGDSKTCTYDKIEGKSFKYAGESQYTDVYFNYDPNTEYSIEIPRNYDSIRLYDFKILQIGLITEQGKKTIKSIYCIRRPHSDSQPINIRTLSRS